jgi:hypothetical protein
VRLEATACGRLRTLLRLIDGLPNAESVKLIRNCETIRYSVKKAELQDLRTDVGVGFQVLSPESGGASNPVIVIRDVLAGCPDERPPRDSTDLLFIKNAATREGLLIDLDASRN